ncbi:MAG: hypothetical protein EBT07_01665 [Actinobacteria bacterium]|jgi:hypothetical protein|nr:hypothetical protein [Actinomycetota bacterium]
MRISVVSYKDADVFEGLDALLEGHPGATVILPITGYNTFVKTALKAIRERKAKYVIYLTELTEDLEEVVNGASETHMSISPNKDILRQVLHEEVFAIAWDSSEECAEALRSVEDFGLETWNISEGLSPVDLEVEEEEELEIMQEAVGEFVGVLIEHVTANVLAMLEVVVAEAIKEELDKRTKE